MAWQKSETGQNLGEAPGAAQRAYPSPDRDTQRPRGRWKAGRECPTVTSSTPAKWLWTVPTLARIHTVRARQAIFIWVSSDRTGDATTVRRAYKAQDHAGASDHLHPGEAGTGREIGR